MKIGKMDHTRCIYVEKARRSFSINIPRQIHGLQLHKLQPNFKLKLGIFSKFWPCLVSKNQVLLKRPILPAEWRAPNFDQGIRFIQSKNARLLKFFLPWNATTYYVKRTSLNAALVIIFGIKWRNISPICRETYYLKLHVIVQR